MKNYSKYEHHTGRRTRRNLRKRAASGYKLTLADLRRLYGSERAIVVEEQ